MGRYLTGTVVLTVSFILYLLDQGTDALTSLLYFLDVRKLTEDCPGTNLMCFRATIWRDPSLQP